MKFLLLLIAAWASIATAITGANLVDAVNAEGPIKSQTLFVGQFPKRAMLAIQRQYRYTNIIVTLFPFSVTGPRAKELVRTDYKYKGAVWTLAVFPEHGVDVKLSSGNLCDHTCWDKFAFATYPHCSRTNNEVDCTK